MTGAGDLEFLSPEWVTALADAASNASVTHGVNLCVQHIIGTGDGEVRYWVRVANGAIAAGAGTAEHADVTFATDAATAWELHGGELDAQEAFRAGRLRLRGDVARIVADRDALALLTDAFAPVRSRTVRTASETPGGGTSST